MSLLLLFNQQSGDVDVTITGAAIAAEAGTSTAVLDTSAAVTGAAISASGGTVAGVTTTPKGDFDSRLTPLGLPVEGEFTRETSVTVSLLGDAIGVEVAGVTAQDETLVGPRLGLLVLPEQETTFPLRGITDVTVQLGGVGFQWQAEELEGANAKVYLDAGLGMPLQVGEVTVFDDSTPIPTDEEQLSGGDFRKWKADYDRYRQSKERRRERQRDAIKAVNELDDDVAKEIGTLIHQAEAKLAAEQEQAELIDLLLGLSTIEEMQIIGELTLDVQRAYLRALEQQNFSAMEAFEREMAEAQREEEEFLMLAIPILQ